MQAVQELTARGVNVNVTLLFALHRYDQVIDAYMTGLERRAARGDTLDHIASVASFFISRVDTKADAELPPGSPLRGTAAITNARRAYRLHHERFHSTRWRPLAANGALNQRPLWASTGTKNPLYSDVRYVEQLIAPSVINTMPLATLEAFDDHGDPRRFPPVGANADDDTADDQASAALRAAGLDMDRITATLEREGVETFSRSYDQLVASIQDRMRRRPPAVTRDAPSDRGRPVGRAVASRVRRTLPPKRDDVDAR
jgi:transaldolase